MSNYLIALRLNRLKHHFSIRKNVSFISFLTFAATLLLVVGCSNPNKNKTDTTDTLENLQQTAFRIRSDFNAPLNSAKGWATDLNKATVVQADQPFRLRFEVEGSSQSEQQFGLQYRRNKTSWEPLTAEDFPYPIKKHLLDFSTSSNLNLTDRWRFIQGSEAVMSLPMENGEGFLRVATQESPLLALGQYKIHWEAEEFAAVMRLPEASQAGIVFGYVDAENYYRVDVIANGAIKIVRIHKDEESTVSSREVYVKSNQWIEVKVVMQGSEVTVEYEWDDYIQGIEFTEDVGNNIPSSLLGIYLPAKSTVEFEEFEIAGEARSPRVSIMSSHVFDYGDPTQDILQASMLPFTGGSAIDYAPISPEWVASSAQSEWEFPIVIRRISDDALLNETGDTFEFRMVDSQGKPLQAKQNPLVTVNVPAGHLGGTFVETPVRIGPWEAANGDLYFLMEPSETDNMMMTVKSTDGGKTWRELDGTNRPQTGDLEGVSSTHDDYKIHTLHQTSDHVFYHVFRTSDHPTHPDTWAITDEKLASPQEPPVQVSDLAVRSDGSVVGVYGNLQKILFKIRSPEGQWSEETIIDQELAGDLSGPVVVRSKNDVVHLAYTSIDGSAWYLQILANGQLTERTLVASGLGTEVEDAGSILPLVYLDELDMVSIIYRLSNGELWERLGDAKGKLSKAIQVTRRSVVQNAADSEQVGADAIGYGSSVHVVFIEQDTGRIFHTYRNENTWSEPSLQVDGVNALWVRGNLIKKTDQGAVYGYIYDAGSMGGSGMNKYAEVALPKR
ncbi:hypothetical protein [Aliiglaciecola lipolytica]|uniref:Uncharacterized protein n=1 Tax=Aliiglaciecola lipolytica E3 TaxID=1127673 RepID=K6WZT1_9ALTE|nr:hypothetical protein [Aliiglaciecola lipolytica]GAC13929.1 hypothetical protein GLIP_1288 [Aliiglaciecola lipolytica E3]